MTVLLSSVSLRAQEIELEKPAEAFATWTDFIVRKDFGNWHLGGLLEYCTIDRGEGLTSNETLVRPIVGYNPLSWLRFQFQVDLRYSFSSGFDLRYMPDITFHWKASDFRFALRTRYVLTHKPDSGKLSSVFRNRFKVDYLIPASPVSVHLAAEPYWLDRFIKTRYYLGADFTINRHLSLTADYVRFQHYDMDDPHQNVIFLTLYVRL